MHGHISEVDTSPVTGKHRAGAEPAETKANDVLAAQLSIRPTLDLAQELHRRV